MADLRGEGLKKGINIALGNDFLTSQGLASLRDIWINIHSGDEPPIALPINKKRMMGGVGAGG